MNEEKEKTADFLKININKPAIQIYIDKGIIENVSHGLYMDTNVFKDEYYILQKNILAQFFRIILL